MLTLALDTATKVCAVGLVKDGRVVAEYDISVGLTDRRDCEKLSHGRVD